MAEKPIPVFQWNSLVPFLTNTQPAAAAPAPASADASQQHAPESANQLAEHPGTNFVNFILIGPHSDPYATCFSRVIYVMTNSSGKNGLK